MDKKRKEHEDKVKYHSCLPIYEQISNKHIAKKLFPSFYVKHGKFLNRPSKKLKLLSFSASSRSLNSGFIKKILKQYKFDKKSFNSIEDFAVFKLNELNAVHSGHLIPNKVRTAIMCDLFESIINSDSYLKNHSILQFLKLELYRSIYFDDNNQLINEKTVKSQRSDTFHLPPIHHISETNVFFNLQTYFDEYNRLLQIHQLHENKLIHFWTANNIEKHHRDFEEKKNKDKEKGEMHKKQKERISLLEIIFFQWRAKVNQTQKAMYRIRLHFQHNHQRQNIRAKRLHFQDWKNYIINKKMNTLTVEKDEILKKYEESVLSSKILLQKNDALQIEIDGLKSLMNKSEIDRSTQDDVIRDKNQNAFSKIKVLRMELKTLSEKLEICRRELKTLRNDETIVFCPILLSKDERRDMIDILSLNEEDIVYRWVNYQLLQINNSNNIKTGIKLPERITNFGSDFANCCIIQLLLSKVRGDENLDFNKLSQCFIQMKRKKICEITSKELLELFPDGLVVYRDLIQNRKDIIFSVVVNLMQKKPMLIFNENNSNSYQKIKNELNMCLKGVYSKVLPSQMVEYLEELIIRSECVLNKADNFKNYVIENNEKWLKIMKRLQVKVTNIYSKRRVGTSVMIKSQNSTNEWLPFTKLQNLLHTEHVTVEQLQKDVKEFQKCENILNENHHRIFETFQFYASSDGHVTLFGLEEVKIWIKDCKLNNKHITEKFIKRAILFCSMSLDIYLRTISKRPVSAKSPRNTGNSKDLSFPQFLELLFRISIQYYQDNKKISISNKLENLIKNHVVRYRQSGNELRDKIHSKELSAVLQNLARPYLYECFMYYSGLRNKSSAGNHSGVPVLNFEGFISFLEELQMISSSFTQTTIKGIFKRAQYQDDKQFTAIINNEEGNYVTFESFLETLVVIAIYKKPDPYIPLETRVEEFLVHSVIDPLCQKQRISTKYIHSIHKQENREKEGGKKKSRRSSKKSKSKKR